MDGHTVKLTGEVRVCLFSAQVTLCLSPKQSGTATQEHIFAFFHEREKNLRRRTDLTSSRPLSNWFFA